MQSIKLSEWDRILFGAAPPEFLLEVLFRSLITYLVLLVVIKLLGKRMSGQLTITEMAIMLTLGAIISVSMQSPDRGLLHGITLLLFVLIYQHAFSWVIIRNKKIENLSHGHVTILVKEGVLQLEQMDRENISREQLFAILRSRGIYQLGNLKRVYLEQNGDISVYLSEGERPGFGILPEADANIEKEIQQEAPDHSKACWNCGNVTKEEQPGTCKICGQQHWEKSVI